jgi:hypothetical protein
MLRLCSDSSRLRAEALWRASTFLSGETCPACHCFLMARHLATAAVMGQESAEAIVGAGRRRQRSGDWKQADIESRKPYPAEGPNEEEERSPNELS